jgi:DNA replication and repair protein RecF
MWLSQLALVNFRNFSSLRLEPGPGVLLFCGRNGQGKTNLLESVYVLATTRSPRTSVERELLNWQAPADPALAAVLTPFARLAARVRRQTGETHLELAFEAERATATDGSPPSGAVARTIKVNGLPTRASGLVGQLPVVYFSPDDVELAGGPPAGRRQYLNLANSQASSSHMRALQRYNRVLLQRNQVLRLIRERRQSLAALEPWTDELVNWGCRVLRQRLTMLRQVDRRVVNTFRELAGSNEALHVVYRSTLCDLEPGATHTDLDDTEVDETALAAAFRARQAQLASREIDQAVTLVGPHRDDFTFLLDEIDLNRFGSRGQQRLAVLALKLAEADWMHDQIGDLPIILLDDVLSELDPQRRRYVLQRVAAAEASPQHQVWITSTEPPDSAALVEQVGNVLAESQRFEIDAGTVRPA